MQRSKQQDVKATKKSDVASRLPTSAPLESCGSSEVCHSRTTFMSLSFSYRPERSEVSASGSALEQGGTGEKSGIVRGIVKYPGTSSPARAVLGLPHLPRQTH